MGAHRLTPAMRDLLHRIRKANRPPLHALGAVEARRLYESAAEVLEPPRAPLPRVETMVLPVGPGIKRPARLYAPQPREALKTVDSALAFVSGERSKLGALQSRFETAISSLNITSENLSASRSRIQDADFAAETANLSRAQILQQAGTAMVAQANQIPQGVLALLRQ